MPDLTAELDLRLELLKRGGKSKNRISKMLRKEVVGSGLRARIDEQRHRFKDAKDRDLVLRLETVGFSEGAPCWECIANLKIMKVCMREWMY